MPRGFGSKVRYSFSQPKMPFGKAMKAPGASRVVRTAVGKINVSVRIKDGFLDRRPIERAIGQAEAKRLKLIGMKIRTSARRSIKDVSPTEGQIKRAHDPGVRPSVRRKRQQRIREKNAQRSKPGEAPLSHTRSKRKTLKYILYYYDLASKSLIVGPVYFRTRKNINVVPGTLEHGGVAVWKRRARRQAGAKTYRAKIEKRPFMNPAMKKHYADFVKAAKDMW